MKKTNVNKHTLMLFISLPIFVLLIETCVVPGAEAMRTTAAVRTDGRLFVSWFTGFEAKMHLPITDKF